MKQVWILNHYAQEPSGAGGTRHFHLAEYISSYGWEATIIAASVELNTGTQRLKKTEQLRLENIKGIPFLWLRTPKYEGNGGGRVLNMLAYSFRVLLPKSLRSLPPPDAIVGSSVHPFAAFAGAVLARRHKVPFIFEVRDLWPQTLIDLGRLKENSWAVWFLRKLELRLYEKANKVVVLLPQAWEYIVPLGIPKERIVWIPNGVDLSLFPINKAALKATKEPFSLMYFGAHGQANGLDNVLYAMAILKNNGISKSITLRIIGDGPLKPELIGLAKKLNLSNVYFEPPVPKKKIPSLASEADAFVFNLINAPVFKFGISSNKLFDFMAGNRPIIFSCDAANNPVAEAEAGLTVPSGNPEELAQAILQLTRMSSEERIQMGAKGRHYVEKNHDFDLLAKHLATVLEESVEEYL